MDLVKSLEDGGCPGPECPSTNVSAFLERIESADPNSPDLSEDDMNGNWGHYQFTAGSMRCATVLQSWDEIGKATACKLLAAAIKTCKVARFVCFTRGIEVGSYLSDAYLQTLVESLWAARQKATRSIDGPNTQVCIVHLRFHFSNFMRSRQRRLQCLPPHQRPPIPPSPLRLPRQPPFRPSRRPRPLPHPPFS